MKSKDYRRHLREAIVGRYHREPTVNELRAVNELPLRVHRHLNDSSSVGRKIVLLLRTCQGDDLRKDETERLHMDVSTLEEAGRLLWKQIFHSPDPDSSRARELQSHDADRLQRLHRHSPFNDFSSDDTSSEEINPDSPAGHHRNSSTILKWQRQSVNKPRSLLEGIPRRPKASSGPNSLPKLISEVGIAATPLYQTTSESWGLLPSIASSSLRCTDPDCARYRQPFKKQMTLNTHIRKYHNRAPRCVETAAAGPGTGSEMVASPFGTNHNNESRQSPHNDNNTNRLYLPSDENSLVHRFRYEENHNSAPQQMIAPNSKVASQDLFAIRNGSSSYYQPPLQPLTESLLVKGSFDGSVGRIPDITRQMEYPEPPTITQTPCYNGSALP